VLVVPPNAGLLKHPHRSQNRIEHPHEDKHTIFVHVQLAITGFVSLSTNAMQRFPYWAKRLKNFSACRSPAVIACLASLSLPAVFESSEAASLA